MKSAAGRTASQAVEGAAAEGGREERWGVLARCTVAGPLRCYVSHMVVKKSQPVGSNDHRKNGKAWKKYIWITGEPRGAKDRRRLVRIKNPRK